MELQSLISECDKSNYLGFLTGFPEQLTQANGIPIPSSLTSLKGTIKNIVIAGMGGSAISGDVVASLYLDEVNVNVSVIRDYRIPAYVDEHTLFIASSYSGNTEETISAFNEALARKARIICVTTGGTLAESAAGNNIEVISIPTGFQPRAAIGFSLFVLIKIFAAVGLIKNPTSDIQDCMNEMSTQNTNFRPENDGPNLSLTIAEKLLGKIPLIYTGPAPLDVLGNRLVCQFNENSKVLAFSNVIPELNHNEIMGWADTTPCLDKYYVLFLRDESSHPSVNLRKDITQEILAKYGVPFEIVHAKGDSKLSKIMYFIYLGDYISFYLAMLNHADPSPIGNINFLKDRLKNK